MQTPRLIAPLAAAAALLAAAPAAQAGFKSVPEPMQFPGDASASAIRADPATWLVGARPGAGARAVARAFGARRDRRRRLRGARAGGRARWPARCAAAGCCSTPQPDALRRTKAVADDPLSKSPDAWRAAVADPNLDPPLGHRRRAR